MRRDPPVKRGGRCAICTRKRPRVAVEAGDPFCSGACARAFHGVIIRDVRGGNLDERKPQRRRGKPTTFMIGQL